MFKHRWTPPPLRYPSKILYFTTSCFACLITHSVFSPLNSVKSWISSEFTFCEPEYLTLSSQFESCGQKRNKLYIQILHEDTCLLLGQQFVCPIEFGISQISLRLFLGIPSASIFTSGRMVGGIFQFRNWRTHRKRISHLGENVHFGHFGAILQPFMSLSHKEEFAVYLPLERASLTENEHFQPKHRADILCYWRRMCSSSHDRRTVTVSPIPSMHSHFLLRSPSAH